MAAVTVESHLGVIPVGLEESYRLLYTVDNETIVNRVGDELDAQAFIAGIREFDILFDDQRTHRYNIAKYTEESCRIRSISHRTGSRIMATSVLEPLPEHPMYEQGAQEQFFFEAHLAPHFKHEIWTPDNELVHPFVVLGKLAALTELS